MLTGLDHLGLERVEQHERGERGRADRVSLGDRLGRVADGVERVGDVPDLLGEVGHLGDPAGVVGDRPERVERDDQARQRQLRHHGDADAVDPGGSSTAELPGSEDSEREHDRGRRRRLVPLGESLDDVRGVAGLRGPRGALHRSEARRGEVVGDHEQARGHADPDQRAQVVLPPVRRGEAGRLEREPLHHPVGDRDERERRERARDDQALVERTLDVPGTRPHGERPDDRGDDRDRAEHERVQRHRRLLAEQQDAEQHHRDRGHGVGLEQVGRHPGTVADVVADVVGDHGGVARIVLGNAGFDLADEVGADVGGLGEDAAAEAGEHRDQRAAEAETDQRVDGLLLALAGDPGEDPVVAGDAQQGQSDDEQPGHRATAERDLERARHAAARGLRHAGVGAHGHVHADVAGRSRQRAADQEPDRDPDVLDRDQDDEQDHPDPGDRRVLAVQVRARPFLHRRRDRAHRFVAGRQREQRARGENAVRHGGAGADERDQHAVMRQKAGQEDPPGKV